MLRYIYGRDLGRYPTLRESMFKDRAVQFRDRLGWEVTVDASGAERDGYDALNPLYVIWEEADGRHGGSMRFLPTTGPTMVADHFLSLTNGVDFASPYIWETTRFCLAPGAARRVSAALMLGGLELGLHHDLSHAIGVFDARMVRVYRMLGWPPAILGTMGQGAEAISAGLWAFEEELRPALLSRAQVSAQASRAWLLRAVAERELVAGTA